MSTPAGDESRRAAQVGGWSLITAAIGFIAVFSYLAARFDYPDVLDGAGSVVLPRLLELGTTGRAVWVVYAFIPLLLIPAAIGAHAALREFAPNVMRTALVCAVIAAVSMLLGLARWPSVHWELARAYPAASPEARVAIDAIFVGLNVYLGNFIGEFLGELALNGFFILCGVGLTRAGLEWIGRAGIVVGVIGLLAAFRNVTPAVALIADVNNYVLPLWLIILGVVLLRQPGVHSMLRFGPGAGGSTIPGSEWSRLGERPLPPAAPNGEAAFATFLVSSTFTITGRGLVIDGQFADGGSIRVGSRAALPDPDAPGGLRHETVTSIAMGHGRQEDGTVYGTVGLVLGDLPPGDIAAVRERVVPGLLVTVKSGPF